MEIITFNELDSTNDYLKENHEKYDDFTVVRAVMQTKGRGRFDRIWNSKKDLTFSMLFKKSLPHHFIAPLTISTVLNTNGFDASIKWPNDILIDNQKVSGILIEKIFSGKQSDDIVGIGINIEPRDDFNYLEKYKKVDVNSLLNSILELYTYFSKFTIEKLRESYLRKCITLKKEVIYNGHTYKAIDVNSNGELIIANMFKKITVNANSIDFKTAKIKK